MSGNRIRLDDDAVRRLVLEAIDQSLDVVQGKGPGAFRTDLTDAKREARWLEEVGAEWLDVVIGEGERGGIELKRRASDLLAQRLRGEIGQKKPRRGGRLRGQAVTSTLEASGLRQAELF
jgi:hypothetical protein